MIDSRPQLAEAGDRPREHDHETFTFTCTVTITITFLVCGVTAIHFSLNQVQEEERSSPCAFTSSLSPLP